MPIEYPNLARKAAMAPFVQLFFPTDSETCIQYSRPILRLVIGFASRELRVQRKIDSIYQHIRIPCFRTNLSLQISANESTAKDSNTTGIIGLIHSNRVVSFLANFSLAVAMSLAFSFWITSLGNSVTLTVSSIQYLTGFEDTDITVRKGLLKRSLVIPGSYR
jgi:hypothetical protein